MKIALDVTPLALDYSGHKVRGVGFYLENLKKSLIQEYPNDNFHFFIQGEQLPSNIDVVHYPYFDPFFFTQPFFPKYPTVVTVHDLTPILFKEHFPSGKKGTLRWYINKIVLKNVSAIITDSKSSKKDIEQIIGIENEKIHVAYLAAGSEFKKINDIEIIQNVKRKYKLPEKYILYVGDVTWNKNLPRLLDAMKNIDYSLVMVGKSLVSQDFDRSNSWNKDLITVQQSIKNNSNIHAVGFVSTEELVSIYGLATALIMPSLYEGFGLPILEAMACGTPVITSKEGSIPEVAGNAAYYVDALDVKSIHDGIIEVTENSSLQKELSLKGIQQSKAFSWTQTAIDTMNVYKTILKT